MTSKQIANTAAIITWFKDTHGIKTMLSDERIAEAYLNSIENIKIRPDKTKQYVIKVPQKPLSLFKLFKKD